MPESPLSSLSKLWKKKGSAKLVALFFLGVLLLLIGGLSSEKESSATTREEIEAYTRTLEERTQKTISSLRGVENVQVMITIDAFCEEQFATDYTVGESKNGENGEVRAGESVVLQTLQGGVRTPVLEKRLEPQVRGVSVVCTGGGDPQIQLKIIGLVQALFDLDANRISVTC